MPKFSVFERKVETLAKLNRPHIAFGLASPDALILKSLKKAKKYADITLVGPKAISKIADFKTLIFENPEEKLATMLVKGQIEGIVRGTVDDFKTYETYQKLTGENNTSIPTLMKDPLGREFFLTPVSNPEGWSKEERLELAQNIAGFVKEWGIKPKIAVFTGERHETYPRKKRIKSGVVGILNKTYEDAEWIVKNLKKNGYDAKNWAIDLNPAVEAGCNLLVAVNGMIGNQILRVVLFCGGKILTCTRAGLSHPYEDNSRTEEDFEFHVKWLVAMINKKKFGENEKNL